jgi:hypothetical protein
MRTPFSAAFFMMPSTIFAPGSSYSELPISMPSSTFLNVKAMPPPAHAYAVV